jgi:predicted GH43/DUF377 family glycosyl hydrolase
MSFEAVKARNEANRLKGPPRTYPEHAPGAKPAPPRVALAVCDHLGGPMPGGGCGSLVRKCKLYDTTTTVFTRCDRAKLHCETCNDDTRKKQPPASANAFLAYDHTNLYPNCPGRRFNAGLVEWGEGYVFCWRDGWAGSNLWACRFDRDFKPVGGAVRIDVDHPEANYGREDPTLFVFNGRLHISFVGVVGVRGKVRRTTMLYARLSDSLRFGVEAVFAPKAPGVPVARWQKNWSFFESGGELHAVYSIAPHKVLRIDGNRAEWAAETPCPFEWKGGELRGGATPYRVGDEFYSFFHDSIRRPRAKQLYRVGLYTFDAAPPFAVRRWVPEPVLAADPATNRGPDANYADVLFPRGAVRDGADWVLSCGAHDRRTEFRRLPAAGLESRLVGVAAG